jgi:hypothetical protein
MSPPETSTQPARRHIEVLAAELWWTVRAMGTTVAAPPSQRDGPQILLAGHDPLRRHGRRPRASMGACPDSITSICLRLSRDEDEARLAAAERRLLHLRLVLGGLTGDGTLGPPVCVVFEGWDAPGKGGAIKRLVGRLDPRHVRVAQFAAPTRDEKRHHFLARFYAQLPGWGGMAVFDRSWYGRVLVERVDGLASTEQWRRGYDEIVRR